jgi:3-oxoisoapionate decarboxylase
MIRLGFDSYSIRAFRWKATQLIDYAAALKLGTIQISGVGEYESIEPAALERTKKYAADRGIEIDAGTGCVCPTSGSYGPKGKDPIEYILQGLRVANAVGSRSMRCFMGSRADRSGALPLEAHIESTIRVFRTVRQPAMDLNVKIALENHGDLQAGEMKALIEEAGKEYVGACLDFGNPFTVIEHPLVSIEVLGPYAVTTHLRDTAVYEHPRGCAFQWVAMGDGSVDWAPIMKKYREACPNAPMQLEIITGRPPVVVPYMEPEFWKAFAKASAQEFARFVGLVKSGRPFERHMVIADGVKPMPAEFAAALKEQQKLDLERSLEFARTKLLG